MELRKASKENNEVDLSDKAFTIFDLMNDKDYLNFFF